MAAFDLASPATPEDAGALRRRWRRLVLAHGRRRRLAGLIKRTAVAAATVESPAFSRLAENMDWAFEIVVALEQVGSFHRRRPCYPGARPSRYR